MPTYNFEKQANGGVSEKQDNVYKRTFFGASIVEVVDNDTIEIIDSIGGRHEYQLTLKTFAGTQPNVFQIEGVTITGAVENIAYQLSTVFPNATATTGGGGSNITSLDEVPQGTDTKKLTAAEYTTLQQIIQAYTA